MIAEILVTPVAPEHRREYRESILLENCRRAATASKILLALVTAFSIIDVVAGSTACHRYLDFAAILGLSGFLALQYVTRKAFPTVRTGVVFGGALLAVAWAGAVSAMGNQTATGYPTLIIAILAVGVVLYASSWQLLILYAAGILTTAGVSRALQTTPPDLLFHGKILLGLITVAFTGSRLAYFGRARDFSRRKQLMDAHALLEAENRAREAADRELRRSQDLLREMVEKKTAQLEDTNRTLQAEISEHARAREELRNLNLALKRRAQDLAHTNEELKSFAYTVSHDLRAPLRAIGGFAQILCEECADALDEKARTYLGYIIEAAHNMNQLVEGLLRLSRVTREELQPSPVDLSDIARSVTEQLRAVQPQHGVDFVLHEELRANADPALIRTVLENLLGNAWKFTEKKSGAAVEFGSMERDGRQVFFVRDNGAGFDMNHAGRLFVPFQRLHLKQDFAGTGVGLSIVQRILHRHGGSIWAEGEPEKGATFYFTLAEAP